MKKMRFILIALLIVVLAPKIGAQDNAATVDLLIDAESKVYTDPSEAGKISEYIINKNDKQINTAEATLILAQSFYIRGSFDETIKNALKARKLANSTRDVDLKLESNFFAIRILRELGLTTVANAYLNRLVQDRKNIKNKTLSTFLKGKLAQDSAYVDFLAEKYESADRQLTQAKSLFYLIDDTLSALEVEMDHVWLHLKTGELKLARQSVDEQMVFIENHRAYEFQKMILLNLSGEIYFAEKEYAKSLDAFSSAYQIASVFPNTLYEMKTAEGLSKNYLALGDSENFYAVEQKANFALNSVEIDENRAINSAYNFISTLDKEQSTKSEAEGQMWVNVLISTLIGLLILGVILRWQYITAIRRYSALWKYIVPHTETIVEHEPKELEKSSTVPEEIEQVLLQKLKKFEAGTRFTAQDMSIAMLAAQLETNTKYLSEVINRHKGKHFNSYINELRINYIIDKLKSQPVYFNYKISYLADECGFSSHSGFTKVFKIVTGISPTTFMSLLQKENHISHKVVAAN